MPDDYLSEKVHRKPASSLDVVGGEKRFWSKVACGAPGDCWPWTSSACKKGYGRYVIGAHRFAYESVKGAIPDGLHIDHTCRNPRCCNPAHLEAVTLAENNRRARGDGATCRRGHIFTPENIIVDRKGNRECRTCRNARKRRYRREAAETRRGPALTINRLIGAPDD